MKKTILMAVAALALVACGGGQGETALPINTVERTVDGVNQFKNTYEYDAAGNVTRQIRLEWNARLNDWQEIIKNYPGAVKADNTVSEAKRPYDTVEDIVTPFPSDEEAPPTPPVQYVTRALSASERIKNYADSLDKEKHSDAYAAIVMMAAAVAAEGLEDNQITIKPMKKPKKKLFSTEAVAEAFKTSKEVIERISEELGLRSKKYGKFVTLVKTGDLMLVRFFYNKKAIRKFSEVLTLAGAEELDDDK